MAFCAPYKYKFLKLFGTDGKSVLEIGAANKSPELFFKYYKNCRYDVVDNTKDCISEKGMKLINRFYRIDLETEPLDSIPDGYYDYVTLPHVIEHIENGESVVSGLCRKVKPGGVFYIEYPSEKSARLPSMKGTLNFYDDPTHKRFYDIQNLMSLLVNEGFVILSSGVKRDILRIIGIPYMIIKSLFVFGYVRGSAFWDLLGFAEYILARRAG